jgi:hypothetical protein
MKPEPQAHADLILYHTEDGRTRIQCRFENETVWLTQQQMAELFQTTKQNVSLHVLHSFKEGELQADSAVKESLTTAADGKGYRTKSYNLDVIISVGYRVKSQRGTQFRIWATRRLREYLVKGFTMDDERLKLPAGRQDRGTESDRRDVPGLRRGSGPAAEANLPQALAGIPAGLPEAERERHSARCEQGEPRPSRGVGREGRLSIYCRGDRPTS